MLNSNLKKLLSPLISNAPICLFKNMILDSRNITIGDLFIAVIGYKKDGRQYIDHAIKNGAVAVIAEAQGKTLHGKIQHLHGVHIIYVNNLNKYLSMLAGRFYNHPSNKMTLIGVTGTNGKTTITHLLGQWIYALKRKSAVLGTLGNKIFGEKTFLTKNTTESAIEIQKFLSKLYRKKITFAAMEVSSHGLVQYRVEDLRFSSAVFSNLSLDHLDYHKNMIKYKKAKWKLFDNLYLKNRIINIDDHVGQCLIKSFPTAVSVSTFNTVPILRTSKWINVNKIRHHNNGTNIDFQSSWGKGSIDSTLLGEFNTKNIMLALATLLSLDYSISSLLNVSNQLKSVVGRMEKFDSPGYPTVIIDYAHNPYSLKQALKASRLHCYGKLWCIFGCGGNRDKNKRSLMGSISEQYADKIIITNDNPRDEEPKNIINNIISGILNLNKFTIVPCRIKAITDTVMNANVKDLILLAGKGHENYQIIENKKIYYSDRTLIKKLLELN